jgi:hypothetical protein
MEVTQMSISRKEIEGFGMPGTTMLARLVTGRGIGDLVEDEPKENKKTVTIRFEPEMLKKIQDYQKRAKTTRTAIVEILVAAGIEATEKQIEIDGQMELPVIVTEKPAKKAGKK